MSKVISFRLDNTNPREARALENLEKWIAQGYSARFILIQALLKMEHPDLDSKKRQDGSDLDLVLDQLGQLIEWLNAKQPGYLSKQEPGFGERILSERFLTSIKHGVKPGVITG